MAIALRQTVSPDWLLNQWQGQGWQDLGGAVVRPVPYSSSGAALVPLQLDAFEWIDVSAFGIGNTGNAVAQLRAMIQARGSDLYAYKTFRRVDVDVLGVKITRYRLLILHSIVQLLEAAVVILAVAFAAVIFWQYMTTGQSPALRDLQNVWGSGVAAVGDAAGKVVGQATNVAWGWVVGLGVAAVALASISKSAGVKAPRSPSGSFGVRAGPVTAKAGT